MTYQNRHELEGSSSASRAGLPGSRKFDGVGQFLRYGIVGIMSNAGGYFVYLLITWMGLEPKIAVSSLYLAGASIGFWGHRKWAFANSHGSLNLTIVRYCAAHILGYSLNLTLIIIFVDHFGYPHQVIQAIAIATVAIFLFLIFKFFVFAPASSLTR